MTWMEVKNAWIYFLFKQKREENEEEWTIADTEIEMSMIFKFLRHDHKNDEFT